MRYARGFVLIASLLLLVVMTLMALAMFHSFGIQELIAGNVREKQRGLQSAEAAAQYAELWLTYPVNVLSSMVDCSKLTLQPYIVAAAVVPPYICLKPVAAFDDLGNAYAVPWTVAAKEVGFTFFPGPITGTGDMLVSTSPSVNTYQQVPRYLIGLASSTASTAVYRIDAWNYSGTTNTASVVEELYTVTSSATVL